MAEQFWWEPPDGGEQVELWVEWGAAGRFAAPVSAQWDPHPVGAGGLWRVVRHDARPMDLPLFIDAEDAVGLRLRLRELAKALDPTRGEGTLRNIGPDGGTRYLRCRCIRGLELGETWGPEAGEQHQRAVATFVGVDPFWYEEEATQQVFVGEVGTPFLTDDAFFTLSPSNIIGDLTIVNDGDVDAQPVWTIRGPVDSVTLTNLTTGRSMAITSEIGAGEIVVIDTRRRRVRDGAGISRFGSFDPSGWFWTLAPGSNHVSIDVPTSTAATEVLLWFQRRYLTP